MHSMGSLNGDHRQLEGCRLKQAGFDPQDFKFKPQASHLIWQHAWDLTLVVSVRQGCILQIHGFSVEMLAFRSKAWAPAVSQARSSKAVAQASQPDLPMESRPSTRTLEDPTPLKTVPVETVMYERKISASPLEPPMAVQAFLLRFLAMELRPVEPFKV